MLNDSSLSGELSNLKLENSNHNFFAQDSDLTPTNSPQTHNYSSSLFFPGCSSENVSFHDGEFGRYATGTDEFDSRSDSSMSWGEDEFEGEATRIVDSLFEQLDQILYKEENIPFTDNSLYIPLSLELKTKLKKKRFHLKNKTQLIQDKQKSIIDRSNSLAIDKAPNIDDRLIQPSEPSSNIIEECSTWQESFPYFRLKGHGVDILRLDHLEAIVFDEEEFLPKLPSKLSEETEEVIDQHGNYEHLLHYTTLNNSIAEERNSKSNLSKKSSGPPSRIYSGSSDPDVIKEQVLIALFDNLWPVVTQIVEPLLNSYAQSLINQSIQLSSLSREQSSKSKRDSSLITWDANSLHQSLEKKYQPFDYLNKDSLQSSQLSLHRRLPDHQLDLNVKHDSFFTGLRRNMSGQHKMVIPAEIYENDITEIHPLNFQSEDEFKRSSSASLFSNRSEGSSYLGDSLLLSSRTEASSHISLPFLGKNSGSISSRQSNNSHNDALPLAALDRRPASTSSFTRLRHHDKFSMPNRESTINEGGRWSGQEENSQMELARSLSLQKPMSFLPPISNTNKQSANVSSSSRMLLTVRGASLSARTRTPLRHTSNLASNTTKDASKKDRLSFRTTDQDSDLDSF